MVYEHAGPYFRCERTLTGRSHQSLQTSRITAGCCKTLRIPEQIKRLAAFLNNHGETMAARDFVTMPMLNLRPVLVFRRTERNRHRTLGILHTSKAIHGRDARQGGDRQASGANPDARPAGHPHKANIFKAFQRAKRLSASDCSRFCSCEILKTQQSSIVGGKLFIQNTRPTNRQ